MRSTKIFGIIMILAVTAWAVDSQSAIKTVKVGYFEAGPYYIHKVTLGEVKEYLEGMKGDSIEIIFEPYAYQSAEWKQDKCKAMASDLVRMKDIDIVIAAGPWVIEDLLAAGFDRTVVGICQYDVQAQGLIDSLGRSKFPHLTVNWAPGKIETDMTAIQKLSSYRRIGWLYFSSGDESAKLKEKLERAASKYNAKIVTAEEYGKSGLYSFFASFAKINRNIDILYVAPMWGMSLDEIRQFFTETENARVPVFASEGFLLLEKGATVSNCVRPDRAAAKFTAWKMLKIINGASPASLPTILDELQAMCLNLESGSKLGKIFSRNIINNAKVIPTLPGDTTASYTISRAIDQGLRENAGILLAGETYHKAIAEAQKAYSSLFPSVNIEVLAAATDNEAEAPIYNNLLNRRFATDIVLDQKLFSFPAIKAIRIAEKKRAMGEANLEMATSDLKHAIVIAYLSVLENQEKVSVSSAEVDRFREYWETAATNHRLGLGDTLDIPFIEENLVAAKISLFNVRNELRIAGLILNVLLNRPGEDHVILDTQEFSPEIMVAMARKLEEYTIDARKQDKFEQFLIETGINNSPEMKTAALSIGIQKELIAQNKKRFLPELSLRAKYSHTKEFSPGFGRQDDIWSIGGVLKIPVITGSEWKYKGRILNAGLDELMYMKDSTRFSRMQNILTISSHLATRVSTLPMSYFTRNLSASNLDSAYRRYDRGAFSVFDLLMIEQNNAELEQKLINDKYQFFTTYVDLLDALGYGYLVHGSSEELEFLKRLEQHMGK